ncbi:PREDICTED: cancer/testis antigen 47A-like [Miniopterus natalensis]|uniref:cancer/testis antigen 47A-like n=1 Tax=Miniopterus natalensis TaxID=291302 RepID=UPI0007A6F616|nr:PREDICTED: cancer/testis antigen 47A-like [Miniopterus natalensis]
MSDSDDGNPAPGGPESPEGEVGAWVREAGAEDAVIFDSGPQGGGDAAGVSGAVGSLGEEPEAVGALEGSNSEEDSDIGPADEGEENMERGPDMVVDAHQFPMVGFRFMFLNLLHALLHRLHYNNHILVRPRGVRRMVRPRHQRPGRVAQIRVLLVPEGSGERVVAMVPHGSRERVVAMVPHGSRERVVAMVHEPEEGTAGSGGGVPALPEPEGQATVQEQSAAGEMAEEAEMAEMAEMAEEPLQEAEAPEGEEGEDRAEWGPGPGGSMAGGQPPSRLRLGAAGALARQAHSGGSGPQHAAGRLGPRRSPTPYRPSPPRK